MQPQVNLNHELRTALAVILRDLAQSLATNNLKAERQTAAPAIFEDTKVDGFLPTQWPRLSSDIHDELAKIATHEFRRSYVPGREIYLYVAGSSGLSRLAKSLQLPVFKLGLTAQPDLLTRQHELRADHYAASIKEDGAYSSSAGFDDWEIRQTELRELPSNPLISSMSRAIRIKLPKGMSPKEFEKKLHQRLMPISLHKWSTSPDAAAHFAALGVSPNVARRYTAYQFGSAIRHSAAYEIYICRPRNDIAKIAALSAQIVRQHILAEQASKSRLQASI
jgi:hypothetical protein